MAFEFNDSNAKQIIESGKPVMIDFWGTYCGPCKALAPTIEELADEYADKVIIGKYNIEEESDLVMQYRIMSIPALLFFKNGEQVKDLRLVGAVAKDKIKANLDKLISL